MVPKKVQTAADVVLALKNRHCGSLFGVEVLCGPAPAPRLDAWTMPRSWAKWQTIGFEVKVSRSDWVNDEKINVYRDYVHSLYIVCPWGLIDPGEVGDGIGLLYLTKTGNRLVTKLKAARGDPKHWDMPLLSLMINRGHIGEQSVLICPPSPIDKIQAARDYLAGKATNREIGWKLGCELARRMGNLEENSWREERLKHLEQKANELGYAGPMLALEALGDGGLSPDEQQMISNVQGIANMLGNQVERLKKLCGKD